MDKVNKEVHSPENDTLPPREPYVISTTMLRTNSVPWLISSSQPAILPVYVGVWFERRDLMLHSLSPSEDVDSIYCIFCLDEDGERTGECVILRCEKCKHFSHLACMKNWLETPHKGAWAALIRSPIVRSLGSEALPDNTTIGGG
ncbi:hypothetical protein N7476_000280 [Penicillium atrosanguineum]|uniref:RING-type domain-containing protein n=1 Tax=Penicillium atrosanguineum TaxID=1132637 RepID=A0A9W9UBH7_9EURO|nr:hypothetical protein N7476_000280 [Penicillium atrosanguineum]